MADVDKSLFAGGVRALHGEVGFGAAHEALQPGAEFGQGVVGGVGHGAGLQPRPRAGPFELREGVGDLADHGRIQAAIAERRPDARGAFEDPVGLREPFADLAFGQAVELGDREDRAVTLEALRQRVVIPPSVVEPLIAGREQTIPLRGLGPRPSTPQPSNRCEGINTLGPHTLNLNEPTDSRFRLKPRLWTGGEDRRTAEIADSVAVGVDRLPELGSINLRKLRDGGQNVGGGLRIVRGARGQQCLAALIFAERGRND